MLVTTPISIDLVRKNFTQFLYVTQDDGNTRAIEVTITVNDQPWAVPEGTVGAVSFKKPDKTSGLYDTLPDGVTKAVTFVENKVTAILAPQVLTAAGDTTVSIALYDDSLNRLGIFPFVLRVERNPSAGQAISNNYYNFSTLAALNDAIGDLAQLQTTNKGSLVAAINELKQGGTGGGGGNDSTQNAGFHIGSKHPADTSMLWVDTSDDTEDEDPLEGYYTSTETDTAIKSYVDTALGVIENGTY